MRRALAALAVLAGAAPAQAALTFGRDCGDSNFECARVTVPLDRSGTVPGTVRLYVERQPAEGASSGAVFALAGGPGQGATTLTESFNRDLFGNIGARDMIVFDQRGTGRSGALNCRALELPDDRPIDVRTARCAERLGPARSLYTTRDSVEDLEAVRAALEIEKISLLGVSYGTRVAVAYAMAYPQHVERLVLDSVVDPLADDPFAREGLRALPRVLEAIDPGLAADVAALADALPVSGAFYDSRGRRRTVSVDARALYGLIRAADLDPSMREQYPAAVRSAVAGDPAALLRAEHRFDDLALDLPEGPNDEAVRSLSFTLQAATLCEETPFPWARTATPAERDAQAAQAAQALGEAAFEPFSADVMLTRDANNLLFQCRRWPALAAAPVHPDRGLPDVPVLVLGGTEDTRTPLEAGQGVAARFPRAAVVAVPGTAHAVLGQRPCAARILRRFFADRALGEPCAGLTGAPLLPQAPASRTGLTVREAVRLTLADLRSEHAMRLFPPIRGGGLRGGSFAERGGRVVVRGYTYVPGVRVSGSLSRSLRRGALHVTGAVRGTFRVRRGHLTR